MLSTDSMFGSRRFRPKRFRALVGAGCFALLAGCSEPPTPPPTPIDPGPPPPNADISGDFRLVAVAPATHTAVCVSSLDPSTGTVMFEAATLRFDTLAARVHIQHRLLHGFACSGSLVGTTSDVNLERAITQRGDSIFIRRPHPAGGEYTDRAVIQGDTLFLRMGVPPLSGPTGPPLGTVVLHYVR